MAQGQSEQMVHETLSRKYPTQERAGGVAQGVGSEFNPLYCKKKENQNNKTLAHSCTGLRWGEKGI
jgi:hypothetical protein